MIADDAARARYSAASKQYVSIAPRMMLAVTGSMVALVSSGDRLAASFRVNSKDMPCSIALPPDHGRMLCWNAATRKPSNQSDRKRKVIDNPEGSVGGEFQECFGKAAFTTD